MRGNLDQAAIRRAILQKYKEVAHSPEGLFGYATGAAGARVLGYDDEILAEVPAKLVRFFCGVGNPLALGEIAAGEIILDVGCGSGFDLFVAGRRVGPEGKVFGIDPTPEMVALAAECVVRSGMTNVKVRNAGSESLPYSDNFFDIVISNGVLNLTTRKHRSFVEIYRVLKPGGRLQFADIVLDEDLPDEMAGNLEAWSN
jgi:SAM-dependent methyltransferase